MTKEELLQEELVQVVRHEFDLLKEKVYTIDRDVAIFRAETRSELTQLLAKSEAAFKKIDTLCEEQKKVSRFMTAGKYVLIGATITQFPSTYEFFKTVVIPMFL